MSHPDSYDVLQRRLQMKRQQRLAVEKEERELEAKLERSRSTQASSFQHRGAKVPGARRQSAGANSMRNTQHSPISASMNRSFTVQPTTSPMDSVPMSSMPMIQEYGGMATGMMSRLSQDVPANVFLLRASQPEAGVSSYPAPDVGANPLDYLAGIPSEEEFPSRPEDFFTYPPSESTAPSLVSGGESAATPMSRELSSVSGSYLMTQELARSESNLSPSMQQWPSQEMYSITNTQQTQDDAKSLCVGNDMFAGMGSSFPEVVESVPMSRSISTSSTSSMRSAASKQGERAKEAHERHIQNGLRNNNLAPKPSDDVEEPDSSSSTASKKDGKVAVAKSPYQRRIKDRVFCKKCKDHPGGFRGQHELSRHEAAKHANVVTRFQVRDPRKAGIPTRLDPVTPLDKCKACQSKKMYGAYYNVAAHLRRSHFRNKQRKQGKKHNLQLKIVRPDNEVPPMTELKKWMVEVKVRGGEALPLVDNYEDVDEPLDFNCPLDMPDLAVSPETNSSISSGSPYEMPMDMSIGLMTGDSGFIDYVSGRLDYSDLADGFAMAPLGVAT